jgi:hypothetical protein
MNWQLDQCYREGCKLERNLAEAQNLLKQCLSAMPVGYIPTHTAENLPEMIGDLAKALAEETTERENLERELAAVTEQRNETSHNLASIVAAILKRDSRDVFDMSATDRLAELHAAERQRNEAVDNYETAVLREHRMQEQRDEALSDLKITQEAWIQAKVERVEALRERDEARETAERYRLEANAMMMQRDRLAEAIRKHRDELELTSGDSVDRILWNALAAVKGEKNE